jgi:hypothetical protein
MVDMSTIGNEILYEDEVEGHADLHALLFGLEADSSLFLLDKLRERLTALDNLDAGFGGFDSEGSTKYVDSLMHKRAKALRIRLEDANAELYRSVRSAIVRGDRPRVLLQWLRDSAGHREPERSLPGLGFDYRDELVSGVLQFREPNEPGPLGSLEMVPYQPTPVRHILDLIADTELGEDDVFVDLGSGLGHVPLLVSMLTGAQSVGIEVQAAYVASARECARSLQLSGVQFVAQDAREADLSCGTVFYLYSPFSGSILIDVLDTLQMEAARRSIKICSLGPCTRTVAKETWLKARGLFDTGHMAVFDSR